VEGMRQPLRVLMPIQGGLALYPILLLGVIMLFHG